MNKQQMIEIVEEHLSLFGKVDKNILNAMDKIDRKNFTLNPKEAYLNVALSTYKNQTISQPITVARILQLLELKKKETVLEIGTGSGWNACLIAYLIEPGKVLSLENHEELIKFAKKNIKKTKIKNLEIQNKDFRKIKEKFNKIVFTAGIRPGEKRIISDFASKNLKDKGVLICPFQRGSLIIFKKNKGILQETYTSEEYSFVPLVLE